MKTPSELLESLLLAGGEIWEDNGNLRIRGPNGLLTPKVKAAVRAHKTELLQILPTHRFHAPLSPGQEALWFIQQANPECAAYNLAVALRVESPLEMLPRLEWALNCLVRRHLLLRTSFALKNGRLQQVIHAERILKVTEYTIPRGPGNLIDELSRLQLHPFNLACEPPLRAHFVQAGEVSVLVLVLHHLATDGWSLRMLVGELVQLLSTQGETSGLAPISRTFPGYVAALEHLLDERGDELRGYWQRALEGAPTVLDLHTPRPRQARQTFAGDAHRFALDTGLVKGLREVAKRGHTTLYTTLLAAFQVFLHRYTGQEDVLVGTPAAGRELQEFTDTYGYMVNPIVIRSRWQVDQPLGFLDFLDQTRQQVLAGLHHQACPFPWVAQDFLVTRDLSRPPVFQVMVVYQREQTLDSVTMQLLAGETICVAGAQLSTIELPHRTCEMDLVLELSERAQAIDVMLRYNSDLFDHATIARMSRHFIQLLRGIINEPNLRVSRLPLLPAAERAHALGVGSGSVGPLPEGATIPSLVEAQVEQTPDAVAIVDGAEQLTYAELNGRANRLARYLRILGVTTDTPVGVALSRRADLIVALLAVMKAGGAYVPIDPKYPLARRQLMLEDSGATLLLSHNGIADDLGKSCAHMFRILDLDHETKRVAAELDSNLTDGPQASDLAYLLYTSGSTGRPKAVAIEHRNSVAMLAWAHLVYSAEDLRGVLAATSVCFDLSVFEVFVPLTAGGTVILAEDALALAELPARERVSLINTVPSVASELLRAGSIPASVQVVNLAGEKLSGELAQRLYQLAHVERVYNLYGPSEATTYSTYAQVPRDAHGEPTIGRPIKNTRVFILDTELAPVPIGVVGELYIGGAGVARCYLGRPELTRQRFIPNPFGEGRLYKTGDLARLRADGELDFCGRRDHQLKLRGFRIELGEIEAALEQQEAVRQAVVVVRGKGSASHLVAYWQPSDEGRVGELRRELKWNLPGFMIPEIYVRLAVFPRTPNGKVDRRALPEPTDHDFVHAPHRVPTNPTQEAIVGLWTEVLQVDRVGVDDNFFALGGHSLLAAQVLARLRELFEVEMMLHELFQFPTVAGLAGEVDQKLRTGGEGSAPKLVRHAYGDTLPVSAAQRRLWFLSQLPGANLAYNMPVALQLSGTLDCDALGQSLSTLVARHESLRTTFRLDDTGPVQVIHPPSEFDLVLEDFSGSGDSQAVEQRIDREVHRTFDLEHGPLLRVFLMRCGPQEHVLLFVLHHIIADGWSLGIIERELSVLYAATGDRSSVLPPLPIQYADYSLWQDACAGHASAQIDIEYWRTTLAGLPPLDLPSDHPRPAVESFRGDHHRIVVGSQLAGELSACSRAHDVTLYVTILTAFCIVLERYTGRQDLAIASGTANRKHPALEGLIGFFVNTIVLRITQVGEPSVAELLYRAQQVVLSARQHEDLPFERVVDAVCPERSLAGNPLAQVGLTLQNYAADGLQLKGVEVAPYELEFRSAKLDLFLFASEVDGGIEFVFEYNTDLFKPATIEQMGRHFHHVLREVVRDPGQPVAEVELFDDETRAMIYQWGSREGPFSQDRGIHQLFETWADKTPEAPAVVDHCRPGRKRWTYSEIEVRANALAHHLRMWGVLPETLVGIYLERSVDVIVAILGVLKAGCAFVSLDPEHPDDRIEMMLDDTNMPVVVSRAPIRSLFAGRKLHVVDIDKHLTGASGTRLSGPVDSKQLAYVIYTSGSTGTPNGVMIEHQSLVNSIESDIRTFQTGPGTSIPHLTSFNFDAALSHLLVMLCAGGTVHLIPRDGNTLGPGLIELMQREAITHAIMPVAMLGALGHAHLPALEVLGAGADVVSPELVTRWAEKRRFFNVYGPTEVAITATIMRCVDDGRPPPIGYPITNVRAYVIDELGRLTPPGVPGELYLGGIGVARGYLNRPDLTARKFIDNPFAEGRLYRTGDRVRWRIDDDEWPALEFLGRLDNQVKIRGFRIELSEVEHALRRSNMVQDAVVTVTMGSSGKRIIAYITQKSELQTDFAGERVAYWQAMHGEALLHAGSEERTFDLRGWTSSYTGEAIDPADMQVWVRTTVERILALHPRDVLEIGCGTGMLLARLAPHVARYHGTDLSPQAVQHISDIRARRPELEHVAATASPADDFSALGTEVFDTVVINSVVQYFPSADYLRRVLTGVVERIAGTGSIFIGDVRNYALLPAFHASVVAAGCDPTITRLALRRRAEKAMGEDNELVLHPGFFTDFAAQQPRVTAVEISLKRGEANNELTLFRYDVTLHLGKSAATRASEVHDWEDENWTLARLRKVLQNAQRSGQAIEMTLNSVPNLRVEREVELVQWLAMGDSETRLDSREPTVDQGAREACNPESLYKLAAEFNCRVWLSWHAGRVDGSFDVRVSSDLTLGPPAWEEVERMPESLHNDPLAGIARRQVAVKLRRELSDCLPAHMVPSAIVVLPALPLTINGKVDISALPDPEFSLQESVGVGDGKPETPVEVELAAIWSQVLGLDSVGVRDNFFALGGDSIMGMQIVSQAREQGISLRASQIFEHQTIAELAGHALELSSVASGTQDSVFGPVALTPIQKWFLAQDLPNPHHFNQAVMIEIPADAQLGLVEQALDFVLNHHDALRHRFDRSEAGWAQRCLENDELAWAVIDLRAVRADEQDSLLEQHAARFQEELDIVEGPLMRAVAFNLGPARGARLLWVIHHLVVDAVSWQILLGDLEQAYTRLLADGSLPRLIKTTSFQRWANCLREAAGGLDFNRERELLKQGVGAVLPLDHPQAQNTKASVGTITVRLPPGQTEALLGQALRGYRLRPQEVLLAALAQTVHTWTGTPGLWVDIEGHGREDIVEDVDLSRTVGWFTSMYPVRLELPSSEAGSSLMAVKEQYRGVPRRGVGYGILRYLAPKGAELAWPTPEISFNYLGRTPRGRDAKLILGVGLEGVGPSDAASGSRTHVININAQVLEEGLEVSFTYSQQLHEVTTMERVADAFIANLDQLITQGCTPGVGALTPCDVPFVELDNQALERVVQLAGGEPSAIVAVYPLTALQAGLLFHCIYTPESAVYTTQLELSLTGPLEVNDLRMAWNSVVREHPLLRSLFVWEGLPEPVQVVLVDATTSFNELDLRSEASEQRLDVLRIQLQREPIKLTAAPLMRLTLVRLGEQEYRLLWDSHHILFDGWSGAVLLRDWLKAYHAKVANRPHPVFAVGRYEQYLQWLKRQERPTAEVYWRSYLQGFEAPTPLVVDRPQPGQSGHNLYTVHLTAQITSELKVAAEQERVTLYTVLQGAWAILLSRYSGQHDILFGVAVSGRDIDLTGIENMVGLFLSNLPIRVKVDEDASLWSWLRGLQADQAQARQHQHLPLVELQRFTEVPGGTPLFNSMLAFENFPIDQATLHGDVQVDFVGMASPTHYPLVIAAVPGEQLRVNIDYACDRFSPHVIKRLAEHLMTLLAGFARKKSATLAELPLLTAPELRALTCPKVQPPPGPEFGSLVEIVAQHSVNTPDAQALFGYASAEQDGGERVAMTYAQLGERSAQLAEELRVRGVGRGDFVGVCVERSLEQVVAMLAVFQAGAVYVPLDPALPGPRLRYMIDDARIKLLLTQTGLVGHIPSGGEARVALDEVWPQLAKRKGSHVNCASASEPAYMIYTSGSTGQPKGVVVGHRALARVTPTFVSEWCAQATSRVLHFLSPSFDGAMCEFVMALGSGACLYIVSAGGLIPGNPLERTLLGHDITHLVIVPSALRKLDPDTVPNLRVIAVVGEACPPRLLRRWAAPGRKLFNGYGPTEATVIASSMACHDPAVLASDEAPPIGYAVADTALYVLDHRLRPVPVGVPGELCIGGERLAFGYHNDPERTARAFISSPFGTEPDARLYRTGDWVRRREDGAHEFLGRIDRQVKIRGHRVELGEIEAVLHQNPVIASAAVVCRTIGGDQRIACFWAANSGMSKMPRELRLWALEHLAAPMVPTYFVQMEELPVNATGKVDRSALPDVDTADLSRAVHVEARNPTEALLVQVWSEVLGVDKLGVHDNFFALGGHSLLAVSVIERVSTALKRRVPVSCLFEHPTIERLAQQIDGGDATSANTYVTQMTPGEGTPIYCFAGLGVHIFYLQELADQFAGRQPVYGVQPLGSDTALLDVKDVSVLATLLADAIESTQADGPYNLVGHSAGARVACAVAEVLEHRGKPTSLVALDIPAPRPERSGAIEWESAGTLTGYLQLVSRAHKGAFDEAVEVIAELPEEQSWKAGTKLLVEHKLLPPTGGGEILRKLIDVNRGFISMIAAYQPKAPLLGPILVVTATESSAEDRDVTTKGWEALTQAKATAAAVTGGHMSMLRAPHVTELAQHIRAFTASDVQPPASSPPEEGFHVTWENPEDATKAWVFDEVHNHDPMTPLDFDYLLATRVHGQNFANEHYGLRVRSRPGSFNSYIFQQVSFDAKSPEEVAESFATAEQGMQDAAARLGELWEESWLPETKSLLAKRKAVDLDSLDLAGLIANFHNARADLERLWEIHFTLLLPMIIALSDFEDAYRDMFPGAGPLDVYELLAGFDNKTVEANLRLWEISQLAAKDPNLKTMLADVPTAEIPALLSQSPAGKTVWAHFVAYLEKYGERNANLYLDSPTWIEDPTPALQGLREATLQPEKDLASEFAAQATRREAALKTVREQLSSFPQPVVEEFEALLKSAQVGTVLREDHNFWLDNKIATAARRICIALGKRLVADGVLKAVEDVFFLRADELQDAEKIVAAAASLREQVIERRAAHTHAKSLTPPPFLGEMIQMPQIDNAIIRANFRLGGAAYGPPPPEGEIRGLPGSRGKAVGKVRIVENLTDAQALKPGEILVAPTTLPTWTAYFGRVAAVVTNIGAILSHAAVVAREYGIPAVVGTRNATVLLADGDMVEVDGDTGVIRVLTSNEASK